MTIPGTVMLLVIAAALGIGVWIDEPRVLPERPLPEPATPALLAAPPSSVARIEWDRGPERLTFVRTEDGWRDAAGHTRSTDVIDGVLETLASLHPHPVAPATEVDLAEYGLAPGPERLRVLDDTGGEALAIDIGNRNPAWTGLYARRAGGDEILLVGALLRWELDKLRSAPGSAEQP